MKFLKLVLPSFFLFAAALSVNAADAVGTVTHVEGRATITTEAGQINVLVKDSPIYMNASIKTSPGARIEIKMIDGTYLTQGELGEMVIDKYIYNPKKKKDSGASVRVIKGVFRVITDQITKINPDRFKVSTNYGTIGIRGCDLGFRISEEREFVYIVNLHHADSVDVGLNAKLAASLANKKKVMTVRKPGMMVTLSPSDGLKISPFGPNALKTLVLATTPIPVRSPASADSAPEHRSDPGSNDDPVITPAEKERRPDADSDKPERKPENKPMNHDEPHDRTMPREPRIDGMPFTMNDMGFDPDRKDDPMNYDDPMLMMLTGMQPMDGTEPLDIGGFIENNNEDFLRTDYDNTLAYWDDLMREEEFNPEYPIREPRITIAEAHGKDWTWKLWEQKVIDLILDKEVVRFEHGTDVIGKVIHPEDYAVMDGRLTPVTMTGTGPSSAFVREGTRHAVLNGTLNFDITVGGTAQSTWGVTADLNNSNGDMLYFSLAGENIAPDGFLTGNPASYNLNVFGTTRGRRTITEQTIGGRMVGPGLGNTPEITGAFLRYDFRHGPSGPHVIGVGAADIR